MRFKKNIGITPFIILLVVLQSVSFMVFYQSRQSLLESQRIVQQASAVTTSFEEAWVKIMDADIGLRGYMITHEKKFLEPYQSAIGNYSKVLEKLESTISTMGVSVEHTYPEYKQAYQAKMAEAQEIVRLVEANQDSAALALILQDSGTPLYHRYAAFQKELYDQLNAKKDSATASYNRSLRNFTIIQLLTAIIALPVLIGIIFILKKESRRRQELFEQLKEKKETFLFRNNLHQVTNQHTGAQQVIQALTDDLENAAQFVKKIAQGDYQAEWEGLSADNLAENRDNLCGALLDMRDQMRQVKEEDQKRLWANEGFARFSELLRIQKGDLSETLNHFLSELIGYLQANQGRLYVVDRQGEENVLMLHASYAYGRRKYFKHTLHAGEGLIGQAYFEKDSILLTEIPADYIKVTSGLGEATPKNLIIIPLIFNEKVEGVIELASFKLFTDHQIQFLKKISENLASTLSNLKINEQTKRLLEESQIQSEMMKAQEEELRQNTEEILATQEEMSRKIRQLERKLQETVEENQQLQQSISALEKQD